MATLETAVREVVADTTLGMSGDDRSGLWISLLEAHPAQADSVAHLRIAEGWVASLERDAARARTADARAVYDSHRLSAYIEIGHPERAIPMLEASERAMPDDYNPPARLANAYKALKRWDEALAASDRAMARAYGPRKLLLMQTRADIYVGRGDRDAARRTIEEAVSYAEALPEGQRSNGAIAGLRKKLDALR
jgi:tetratricopeptide (TPR) repeat protein